MDSCSTYSSNKTNLKKMVQVIASLLLSVMIGATLVLGADGAMNAKKRAYLKDAMPAGWKHEAGYTLWRSQRGLAATPQTWKKYIREKKRLDQRDKPKGLDTIILDGVDWTVEEIAKFLESQPTTN